jgi:hypothetical protein
MVMNDREALRERFRSSMRRRREWLMSEIIAASSVRQTRSAKYREPIDHLYRWAQQDPLAAVDRPDPCRYLNSRMAASGQPNVDLAMRLRLSPANGWKKVQRWRKGARMPKSKPFAQDLEAALDAYEVLHCEHILKRLASTLAEA